MAIWPPPYVTGACSTHTKNLPRLRHLSCIRAGLCAKASQPRKEEPCPSLQQEVHLGLPLVPAHGQVLRIGMQLEHVESVKVSLRHRSLVSLFSSTCRHLPLQLSQRHAACNGCVFPLARLGAQQSIHSMPEQTNLYLHAHARTCGVQAQHSQARLLQASEPQQPDAHDQKTAHSVRGDPLKCPALLHIVPSSATLCRNFGPSRLANWGAPYDRLVTSAWKKIIN